MPLGSALQQLLCLWDQQLPCLRDQQLPCPLNQQLPCLWGLVNCLPCPLLWIWFASFAFLVATHVRAVVVVLITVFQLGIPDGRVILSSPSPMLNHNQSSIDQLERRMTVYWSSTRMTRSPRGCFSDLPPDMLKPAANQAFGSKSSFWQQMKKNLKKHTNSYFRKTAIIFGDKKIPKKKLAANHFLQETQVSAYLAANHLNTLWSPTIVGGHNHQQINICSSQD